MWKGEKWSNVIIKNYTTELRCGYIYLYLLVAQKRTDDQNLVVY